MAGVIKHSPHLERIWKCCNILFLNTFCSNHQCFGEADQEAKLHRTVLHLVLKKQIRNKLTTVTVYSLHYYTLSILDAISVSLQTSATVECRSYNSLSTINSFLRYYLKCNSDNSLWHYISKVFLSVKKEMWIISLSHQTVFSLCPDMKHFQYIFFLDKIPFKSKETLGK